MLRCKVRREQRNEVKARKNGRMPPRAGGDDEGRMAAASCVTANSREEIVAGADYIVLQHVFGGGLNKV